MRIDAKVVGLKPLLQARFNDESALGLSAGTKRIKATAKKSPREVADALCYRFSDGTLWHPGRSVMSAIREAAAYHRMKSSRKSMKAVVPGAVQISEEELTLLCPETWRPLKTFEVDSRRVVNSHTRGAQMAHRPRFDRWAIAFSLEIDDEMIDEAFVQQLLTEAGKRIGIGCFRPQNGGPYGMFRVVQWAKQNVGPSRRGESAQPGGES